MAHDILPINYYILTLLWCVYAVRLFLTFIRFGYLRWTSSSEILYSLRHRLHPHPHPFSLCCCEAPMEWSHNCFRYNGNHIINRLKNDFYAIGPAFLSLQEQTKNWYGWFYHGKCNRCVNWTRFAERAYRYFAKIVRQWIWTQFVYKLAVSIRCIRRQ